MLAITRRRNEGILITAGDELPAGTEIFIAFKSLGATAKVLIDADRTLQIDRVDRQQSLTRVIAAAK